MVGPAPAPRTLQLDTGPLNVDVEGTGRPLVLLHGAPGTPSDFDGLVDALERDWRVVRVALPGFGRTPRATASDPSAESIADVVCAAIDSLGLEDCVVAGHSFGAAIAGSVAARVPERVSALALIAPVGLRPHRAYRWSAPRLSARLLAAPGIGAVLRALLPGFFRASGFASPPPKAVLEFTMTTLGHFDWDTHRQRVDALAQPTLVAWADDDPLFETTVFEELSAAAPEGPRLRFETGGHFLPRTQAADLAACIERMVDETTD
jgi:pimeloyl-ACP methyl ester carboxylesterase